MQPGQADDLAPPRLRRAGAVLAAIRLPRAGRGQPRTRPDHLIADKGDSSARCREVLQRDGAGNQPAHATAGDCDRLREARHHLPGDGSDRLAHDLAWLMIHQTCPKWSIHQVRAALVLAAEWPRPSAKRLDSAEWRVFPTSALVATDAACEGGHYLERRAVYRIDHYTRLSLGGNMSSVTLARQIPCSFWK